MLKKLFILCLITIVINANAQVIKQGGKQNPTTDDTYYNPYGREQRPREEKPFEFKKRSLIQINIFQFVFTNVSLSYEFFSKDGKSGFHIPFTFGIGGKPDNNPYPGNNNGTFIASQNRIFESGLHYHYYPLGQRRTSPFLGVGFNVGGFNYWNYTPNYVYNNGYTYAQQIQGSAQVGTNYSGALFGGFLFNPNETITFGMKAGLGFMRKSTSVANYIEYTHPYGVFEVNLGFKF